MTASQTDSITTPVIDPEWTVREVVTRYPASVAIFKAHSVEACCDAGRPLGDAAQKAGMTRDELLAALHAGLGGSA